MNTTTPGNSRPEVSILMTAFNSEQYLPEAIRSILAQKTSFRWELLFVDDGSSDNTYTIARELAKGAQGRMRIFQHPHSENRGISASRNLALQHACGEFLAFLDSDDVWLPHHLQTQITLLQEEPAVAMVYAGAERWHHFDQPFCEHTARNAWWGENFLPPLVPAGKAAGLLPRGELLSWFQRDESFVPCICTVVLRTAIARAVGGFCEEFRGLYDDQAFHSKVVLRHDVYANDMCTARYRQHEDSCCHRSVRSAEARQSEQQRFQHFLEEELCMLKASHLPDQQPLLTPTHSG